MIVADRFVFLHLHKSGGTFVNEALLRLVPGARQIGYHLPRSLIPAEHAAKPVLGLIRNPWSYYVSWYAFQAGRPVQNALFQVLSEGGRLGFEGTVRNMLDLGSGGARLDDLLAALPPDYVGRGLNLPAFALEPIRGTGLGFYSFLHGYMFGGGEGEPARLGRMERLAEELPAQMAAAGAPASGALLAFLRNETPRNASAHRPYQGYYSGALEALVADRDRSLIEAFGYDF